MIGDTMLDDGSKTLLFCGLLAAGFVSLAAQSGAPQPYVAVELDDTALPAAPAPPPMGRAPVQTSIPSETIALGDGFQATLLHGYGLTGRVVTRREFQRDPTSAISPLDLGIVWGALADPARADDVSFRAGNRAVSYRAETSRAMPAHWEQQVTNNHLIPASGAIREALLDVDVGQMVRISGYLVIVTGNDIRPWRSSTRRNDNTIIGGCEIILVTGVELVTAPDKLNRTEA